MTSHRINSRRQNRSQRRRALVRRIIDALLRGKADEDTAAVKMQEADRRGSK